MFARTCIPFLPSLTSHSSTGAVFVFLNYETCKTYTAHTIPHTYTHPSSYTTHTFANMRVHNYAAHIPNYRIIIPTNGTSISTSGQIHNKLTNLLRIQKYKPTDTWNNYYRLSRLVQHRRRANETRKKKHVTRLARASARAPSRRPIRLTRKLLQGLFVSNLFISSPLLSYHRSLRRMLSAKQKSQTNKIFLKLVACRTHFYSLLSQPWKNLGFSDLQKYSAPISNFQPNDPEFTTLPNPLTFAARNFHLLSSLFSIQLIQVRVYLKSSRI